MNIKILLISLLACWSLATWSDNLLVPGIDFYHYWGVAKAQQFSKAKLKNPYINTSAYADSLNTYVDAVSDPRLKQANVLRRKLDLTGTPLLYTFFSVLPNQYTVALVTFRSLQLAAFFLAIILLSVVRNNIQDLLSLGLTLCATFIPFYFDLQVANVNTFQLLLITILTLLIFEVNVGNVSTTRTRTIVCLSIFITLFKPNLLLPAFLANVSLLVRTKFSVLREVLITMFLCLTVIWGITSLFLGSPLIWVDWYRQILASPDRLVYAVESGNYSMTLFLATTYGINIPQATHIAALVVCSTVFCAIFSSIGKQSFSFSNFIDRTRQVIEDTGLLTSLAIVSSLSLSPLVWPHYHVLLIFPVLWISLNPKYGKKASSASMISIFFISGLAGRLLAVWIQLTPEIPVSLSVIGCMLSWLSLLLAIKNLESFKKLSLASSPEGHAD